MGEGDILQLREKLQEAEQDAQWARDAAKAAEAEMDEVRTRMTELEARMSKGKGPL